MAVDYEGFGGPDPTVVQDETPKGGLRRLRGDVVLTIRDSQIVNVNGAVPVTKGVRLRRRDAAALVLDLGETRADRGVNELKDSALEALLVVRAMGP